MIYDKNISIDARRCRPVIGPDHSRLWGASLPHIAYPALERGTPGHATGVQMPTRPTAPAATGPPPGDPCAATTDPPRRSAALASREPGDLCPAPVHGPAPRGACGAQGPHRGHRAPRLARRPRARPGAWGGVREGPPRRAEARRRSQGSTTAVWTPTPDGVSAGRLAADMGQVPQRPSVRTTLGMMGGHRLTEGACACCDPVTRAPGGSAVRDAQLCVPPHRLTVRWLW
jgi:hypothetical protein